MMRKSIYQQYKKLMGSHSQSANCYTVINVPFSKTHKLGVGIDDRPMFFIRSSITDNAPNINLELITVQFNELCRLKKDTESKFVNENYYTVITLKSKQIDYIEYFLDVVYCKSLYIHHLPTPLICCFYRRSHLNWLGLLHHQ